MNQRAQYVKNRSPEQYEIVGLIKHETNDATLMFVAATDETVWIPNSQIHSKHRERAVTGWDRLCISAWIAKKKGIIE